MNPTRASCERLRPIAACLAVLCVAGLWIVDAQYDALLRVGLATTQVFGRTLPRANAEALYSRLEGPLLVAAGGFCLLAAGAIYAARRTLRSPTLWLFAVPPLTMAAIGVFRPHVPLALGEVLSWCLPTSACVGGLLEVLLALKGRTHSKPRAAA